MRRACVYICACAGCFAACELVRIALSACTLTPSDVWFAAVVFRPMSAAQYRAAHGGIKWVYLTPLFYAPVLPMSTFQLMGRAPSLSSSPSVLPGAHQGRQELVRVADTDGTCGSTGGVGHAPQFATRYATTRRCETGYSWARCARR